MNEMEEDISNGIDFRSDTESFRTGEYDMNEMEEDISNGIDFRSVNRAPLGLENTT
jgi:hypothetical protein